MNTTQHLFRRSMTRGLASLQQQQHLSSSRFASTLIVAEHNNHNLNPSTLSTVTAAQKIGGDITVLIAGKDVSNVSKQVASIPDVAKVLIADSGVYEHQLAENISSLVTAVVKDGSYSHILAPSSNNTKNYIPRVAVALDVAPITDVIDVESESIFKRPMYAGNAIATVESNDETKLLTIRATAFDKSVEEGGSGSVEDVTVAQDDTGLSSFVSANTSQSDRPDLSSADIVISGGRGMKNGENFKMLEELADKLGAAVGASRAAVDAGFVPNELQVGQTGKVVAPELYIAVGISGAIQHLSGMKDSKTIVAINKDKEAPIFQVADYGLCEDLFKAVPELQGKL